jgi:hypothetical protein
VQTGSTGPRGNSNLSARDGRRCAEGDSATRARLLVLSPAPIRSANASRCAQRHRRARRKLEHSWNARGSTPPA